MRKVLIRSLEEKDDETGKPLYWNNELGWASRDAADVFDMSELSFLPDKSTTEALQRFIVAVDEPTWVRQYREVYAPTEEAALEQAHEGNYEYLGHQLRDRLSYLDNENEAVTPVDEAWTPRYPSVPIPEGMAEP